MKPDNVEKDWLLFYAQALPDCPVQRLHWQLGGGASYIGGKQNALLWIDYLGLNLDVSQNMLIRFTYLISIISIVIGHVNVCPWYAPVNDKQDEQ